MDRISSPNELATYSTADGTCYGHDLKEKHFLLGEGYTNMNHGSYGTVPKSVAEYQSRMFQEQESHPDRWFRSSIMNYTRSGRELLARLMNCDSDGLVLVENASAAVNAVLRSIGLKRGSKVLRLSTAYQMVVETLDWLIGFAGIEVVVVPIEFPVKDTSQIVSAVRTAAAQNPDISFAVLSHITSMPAVVMPIAEMVSILRDHCRSVLIMIDGAHAPGQIPVQISSMNVDYYIGNCHKWMFAPKGTAFMWVTPQQRLPTSPEPTVISSSGKRDYLGRFEYTGTRDYTAFASLLAADSFINYLGGSPQVQQYCRSLAIQGGRLLTALWDTSLLVSEDQTGFMINIVLPSSDPSALKYTQEVLDKEHNVFMVYGSVSNKSTDSLTTADNLYFTRLSAQVYIELSDFEVFGKLLLSILNDFRAKF